LVIIHGWLCGPGGVTGTEECTFAPHINARSSRLVEHGATIPAGFTARCAHFDKQRSAHMSAALAMKVNSRIG
jgi:hypothetical protein